jgi:hypothetical protein
MYRVTLIANFWNFGSNFQKLVRGKAGILKLDAVDAVDAVHPVPTKTGCSASSTY